MVSVAEDTSDSIFSVADIPWALRRTWSKGVDRVPEAADTWSSLDADDTLEQTERKVSVVGVVVRQVLSVVSVSYSRGLTWRSSPTVEKGVVASSSVLCPLR